MKGFAALLGGEEATASHILVKDPSLATSLLERLQEGPQDNLEVGVVLFRDYRSSVAVMSLG